MQEETPQPPLSYLRVLELGTGEALAYSGKIFADFGADVLKVEPDGGDPARRLPPLATLPDGTRESAYFAWLNTNKRSVRADDDAVAALARDADLVLDARPGERHGALRAANPGLAVVAISWFGESGPYRDFAGSDAVCRALAGLGYLTGPASGPPVLLADHQAAIHGGVSGFIAAMAALRGGGRLLAVSIHEAAIALAEFYTAQAKNPAVPHGRCGVNRYAATFPLGNYRCREGWIGITIVSKAQWNAFCELLGLDGLADDPRCAVGAGRFAIADELEALFAPRLLERTAEEWFALALERRLPFVVVPDIATLLSSPAHRRRGSFGEVEIAGRRFEAPRLPHNLTLTPPRRGGAAPRAGSAEPAWRSAKRPPLPCGKGAGLPLAGVRVVDLSMGWAGPLATRQLADLGAEIIKVEACQYPDWWRGNDARPETLAQKLYEKAPIFQLVNRNKTGITLDLTSPEGASLLKRLVAGADAVVENYSREVLPKLGLGYPALRAAKPDLVMVSMPAFGADHDWADCRAYGSTLEQASGLPSVSGEENWPPLLNHIAYGDAVGGMNAAAALLIALAHRDRTGEGQHIDLSQVECMLPFVAPWIIEQSLTGRVGPRTGSRHPVHAPHNVFRCAGEDAWIFVAVTGDAEWHSLCRAIGRPDLALDERLRDASGRRRHLAEIEAAVAAWTAERQADAAMDALQRAGVAAGVLRSPFRLTEDPHLAARGFWQIVDRPFVGAHAQPSAPWREGDRPYPVRRPAPMLGEHTRETLARLLGLGAAELDALEKRGVIGTEAAPASGRKSRAASS